ncbi:hypothetical protein ACTWQB_13115 [Piscibacillus sp. B03]|uniref:hypothetical protein n=1 Tax=Piscibacillus sp. B03 TaxID=3457430 RepID=UPI003FCCB3BD
MMNVLIKGCFEKVAYHLIYELVDQEFEVYGIDDLEDDDKFEKYAMVGRHASFHLEEEESERNQFDFEYDFTNERALCTFFDRQKNVLTIYIDNQRDEQLTDVKVASWLATLPTYTFLPKKVCLNGENEDGIHFVK